ncbi:hypothetical protein OAE25_01990 [Verrucomicrobiales bacterium]|nr:hypothetical protein [Verrucomicrobiales bacterium]
MSEVLTELRPAEVIYIGDTDVVFNAQFSEAAIGLKELLAEHPASPKVMVLAIAVDSPGKGEDDCRGELGDGFRAWFSEALGTRIPLKDGMTKDQLAVGILENQLDRLKQRSKEPDWTFRIQNGLAKLAVCRNAADEHCCAKVSKLSLHVDAAIMRFVDRFFLTALLLAPAGIRGREILIFLFHYTSSSIDFASPNSLRRTSILSIIDRKSRESWRSGLPL